MAKVYASLIRKGLKTLEDVPLKLRDSVVEYIRIMKEVEENENA